MTASTATGLRVVVVGGTGNISTPVVRALVDAGYEVTVFSRGTRNATLPAGVRLLRGDRRDRSAFEAQMQSERFDFAIDMVCFEPGDAESDLRAFDGVAHLLHTSTVSTFGVPLGSVPADESAPLRPTKTYGAKKARADEVFLAANRSSGFPVTVLKPAHTWGPGMPVIRQLAFEDPCWIARLREGRPLLLAGDGSQRWSICHSDDAAAAYLGLLGKAFAHGETYIVTGLEPISWIDYHRQIAEAIGGRLNPVYAPAEELIRLWPEGTSLLADTRWDCWYDAGKLRAAVPSFRPRFSLLDRAAEHIAWAESHGALRGGESREDTVIECCAMAAAGRVEECADRRRPSALDDL